MSAVSSAAGPASASAPSGSQGSATPSKNPNAPTPRAGASSGARAIAAVDAGDLQVGNGAGRQEEAVESQGVPEREDPFAIPDDDFDTEVSPYGDQQRQAEEQAQQDSQKKAEEGRAQKRIRALAQQAKSYAEKAQAVQQQLQQHEQWNQKAYQAYQSLQQQLQQQQIELARYKAQSEMAPKGDPDPVSEFRQKVLSEAEERLNPKMKQAIDRVQQLEQRLASERQQQEQHRLSQQYNEQTDAVLARHVAPFLSAEGNQKLGSRLGSYVLQEAMLSGADLESAAKNVRNFLFEVARDVMKHRSATVGARMAQTQQAPPQAPRGRADAKTESFPDYGQLRKAGFKNYVEWETRGRPKLT